MDKHFSEINIEKLEFKIGICNTKVNKGDTRFGSTF